MYGFVCKRIRVNTMRDGDLRNVQRKINMEACLYYEKYKRLRRSVISKLTGIYRNVITNIKAYRKYV